MDFMEGNEGMKKTHQKKKIIFLITA